MTTSFQLLSTCKKCKALCCNLVKPPITEKEKNIILDAGFQNYFIKIKDDIYEINPDSKGQCPYLKKDFSCKIHNVKPNFCKIWPVIPRYKNGKRKYVIIKCPIFPYIDEKEIRDSCKEAEKIPKYLIEHLWTISKEFKEEYKRFDYFEI